MQYISYKFFSKVISDLEPSEITRGDFFLTDKPVGQDAIDFLNTVLLKPSDLGLTFYKTLEEVISKTRYELLVDQILHYQSTYGTNFEGPIYIPNSSFSSFSSGVTEVPELLLKNIKVIKTQTFSEFKKHMIELLKTNTKFTDDEVCLLKEKLPELNLDISMSEIVSLEAKMVYTEITGEIPEEPEDILRFLIYKTTGQTLLIKSPEVIKDIKLADKHLDIKKILQKNTKKLSTIFNRFKPLFLAFKPEFSKEINKISRLSKTFHVPKIQPSYLKITSGDVSLSEVRKISKTLDTMYLVKIANSILFKLESDIGFYNVRNGKVFTKQLTIDPNKKIVQKHVLEQVLDIIKEELQERFKDVKVKSSIDLAIPCSGKQFVGNIPFGSAIGVPSNFVFGVYWEGSKVDLDLSITSLTTKIGWNSDYTGEYTFSGDITSAPMGGAELFRRNSTSSGIFTVNLNYYNFSDNSSCKYKFFIASGAPGEDKKLEGEFTSIVDPNDVIFELNSIINTNGVSVGFVLKDKFMFGSYKFNSNVADISDEQFSTAAKSKLNCTLKFSDFGCLEAKEDEEISKADLLRIIQETNPKF